MPKRMVIYLFTAKVLAGPSGDLASEHHDHLSFPIDNVQQLKSMVTDLFGDRLSACRTTENSSLAETRSDGCGTVCPVAGLARTLPLQSRTGLRVRIACKGRRSTALALKRDVKTHPTCCEVGRNPKARSLARIQTLIRNASERER